MGSTIPPPALVGSTAADSHYPCEGGSQAYLDRVLRLFVCTPEVTGVVVRYTDFCSAIRNYGFAGRL